VLAEQLNGLQYLHLGDTCPLHPQQKMIRPESLMIAEQLFHTIIGGPDDEPLIAQRVEWPVEAVFLWSRLRSSPGGICPIFPLPQQDFWSGLFTGQDQDQFCCSLTSSVAEREERACRLPGKPHPCTQPTWVSRPPIAAAGSTDRARESHTFQRVRSRS
jgi:hypothetical protein